MDMQIQNAPTPSLPKLLPAPSAPATEAPAPAPAPAAPADAVQLQTQETEAEARPEQGTFQKMKAAFFREKRVEGQDTQGSPFMKLMFGGVCASGVWCAAKVIADVAGAPTVGAAITTAALSAGALAGGYILADLPSGLLHHWADNYAKPDAKIGVVRKFAQQAQRHHFFPGKLGHYSLSYWAFPLSTVAWAPLVGAAALGAPAPVLAGAIGLIGGMSVYGKFHQWSHMNQREVPKHGKLLQKMGVAIDPRAHGVHHRMPWNSDYCIVSGALNKPLDKIKFWPRYEKAIYKITGAKPDSWNVPEYKDYVDGKISKEEYIARSKEMMKNFRATEMPMRKEKWGIDASDYDKKPAPAATEAPAKPAAPPAPEKVDFSGNRPAHRVVKKLARGGAAVVGTAGLAKIGFDLFTSGSLEAGLAKAALTALGTGAAIVGMDLASGVWHHKGDNYGKHAQTLKHTQWHTNTHDSDYCLIGVSNKALDAIGFWPKWEKAIYHTTGAEPVAWKVQPYKDFALGKISEEQLTEDLAKMGMPK